MTCWLPSVQNDASRFRNPCATKVQLLQQLRRLGSGSPSSCRFENQTLQTFKQNQTPSNSLKMPTASHLSTLLRSSSYLFIDSFVSALIELNQPFFQIADLDLAGSNSKPDLSCHVARRKGCTSCDTAVVTAYCILVA